MTSELPIACTLTAEDRAARLAEIEAFGNAALLGVRPDGSLRFLGDPETRARLEAILAAESECCPFLDFGVRASGRELLLTISAPDGGDPVVRELAGAFRGTRG